MCELSHVSSRSRACFSLTFKYNLEMQSVLHGFFHELSKMDFQLPDYSSFSCLTTSYQMFYRLLLLVSVIHFRYCTLSRNGWLILSHNEASFFSLGGQVILRHLLTSQSPSRLINAPPMVPLKDGDPRTRVKSRHFEDYAWSCKKASSYGLFSTIILLRKLSELQKQKRQ